MDTRSYSKKSIYLHRYSDLIRRTYTRNRIYKRKKSNFCFASLDLGLYAFLRDNIIFLLNFYENKLNKISHRNLNAHFLYILFSIPFLSMAVDLNHPGFISGCASTSLSCYFQIPFFRATSWLQILMEVLVENTVKYAIVYRLQILFDSKTSESRISILFPIYRIVRS